jgi:ribosome-associated protein
MVAPITLWGAPPDPHRDARVGVVAVELRGDVELDEIALAQPPGTRDAVDRLVVDADAGGAGKAVGELGRRARAGATEDPGGDGVELAGGDARPDGAPHRPQDLGHDPAGGAQPGKLLGRLDRHAHRVTGRGGCPVASEPFMAREIPIRGEMIRLGQLLKVAGVIDSGAEVKAFLTEQTVLVNGEPEDRRGRQLRCGDVVTAGDDELRVTAE